MVEASADKVNHPSLQGVVAITTGGGVGEQRQRGELNLLTLPKYIREKLGMRFIDVNTRWFTSYKADYLRRVREAASDAGCVFTNLKVNHAFGDLYSRDAIERRSAMLAAKKMVDVASVLGARWIRFPLRKSQAAKPDSHRQLAAYAEPFGIQLLIENGGGQTDPLSVTIAVKAIGRNVAACPDTGNWADAARAEGLRKSFPAAASCDFKVFELDTRGQHPKYDLKECFDIGWNAGFRGPWVIEHMKPQTENFVRDTILIRDKLKSWVAKAEHGEPEN
jgi:sugar phosphate isomerase/epimerase